ncbi:MAG: GrrA/OscA1 family cyclophane-containing rSAM-modified RiPP [Cyanobium sp.]
MPQSPSAGLLAFLLALPTLSLVVPPPSEAVSAGAPASAEPGPGPGLGTAQPGEAMDVRLRRLSDAIRERASQLEPNQPGGLPGESWLTAGAWGNGGGRGGWGNGGGRGWGNGGNRGWGNRAWGNGSYGNSIYVRPGPVWANFRPGWNNFSNGPSFLNW